MLAGKISFNILVVGFVTFLAVSTMNSSTSFGHSLTEERENLRSGKYESDEEAAFDNSFLGLRRRESVMDSTNLKTEDGEERSYDALRKKRGNLVKGSHRSLWWYYPPTPAPKYWKAPSAPKYPPRAPKSNVHPAPKYNYAPPSAPTYNPVPVPAPGPGLPIGTIRKKRFSRRRRKIHTSERKAETFILLIHGMLAGRSSSDRLVENWGCIYKGRLSF